MNTLVYCIMRAPSISGEPMKGVNGKEVYFITAHDLCAAVSELPTMKSLLPVSELLAYGKVSEQLYRMQTIIPIRYGCFLDAPLEIHNLLKVKHYQYDSLLTEMDGCVEMGIRILFPEQAGKLHQGAQSGSGSHYLALRRAHYQMQDENSRHYQSSLDECVMAFSGIYNKHLTETATINGRVVLSLFFLIPKSLIKQFREIFRQAIGNKVPKAMISGPWPPYNFAASESS